jgi:hypothetical protein
MLGVLESWWAGSTGPAELHRQCSVDPDAPVKIPIIILFSVITVRARYSDPK